MGWPRCCRTPTCSWPCTCVTRRCCRRPAIRTEGDWEGWLTFFLRGVVEVSRSATQTARDILALRERARTESLSANAQRLIEAAFANPVLKVRTAESLLQCTYATANKAVRELEAAGFFEETTGNKRNRRYRFTAYIRLFDGPVFEPDLLTPADATRSY